MRAGRGCWYEIGDGYVLVGNIKLDFWEGSKGQGKIGALATIRQSRDRGNERENVIKRELKPNQYQTRCRHEGMAGHGRPGDHKRRQGKARQGKGKKGNAKPDRTGQDPNQNQTTRTNKTRERLESKRERHEGEEGRVTGE